VRGLNFLKLFKDRLDDAACVRENVVIPEAQYTPTFRFEKGCALSVGLAVGVLAAVRFDDELMAGAGEIDK